MTSFPWRLHLKMNSNTNRQTTFTETLLNIMANFVPNEMKTFVPRDPPWINKELKTLLNKKNRLFRNYKRKGYTAEDKVRLEVFRNECQKAVENAKQSYFTKMGDQLSNPETSQKTYWKIIHKVVNKCKAKIPPLSINGSFILGCKEKANHFVDFFSQQCKLISNDSTLPNLTRLTDKKIDMVNIGDQNILALIRNLNPKKATGPDGISGQMLLICDDTVVLPLLE